MTRHSGAESAPRFGFGDNWRRFLAVVDEDRVQHAEAGLRKGLDVERLDGRTFLDVGCGSGLSSLAARRLGARVHSFDFDPESVACARSLRARFFPDDPAWTVETGSALDHSYLDSLGEFDVVYAWGVLHHTGEMWSALEAVQGVVRPGGLLWVAIYNDGGISSRYWRAVKRTYCASRPGRWVVLGLGIPYLASRGVLFDLLQARNPIARFAEYRKRRGMSVLHDWVDWLGGYPYEFARPEAIFEFLASRGYRLERLRTSNAIGINELVMRRG